MFRPLFRLKKDKKQQQQITIEPAPSQKKEQSASNNNDNSASESNSNEKSNIHPKPDLVFCAQLAHGSETKKIKDFRNVKFLYERISAQFDIEANEIIFCTLNTHKIDMSKLLGGQIGLNDFIYAHCKGQSKSITIVKSKPALGLTITDNGSGLAFIKRIKEDSLIANIPTILTGDLIDAINGTSMVGKRHYEVAKVLKELPLNVEFSFKLVEPKKGFEVIAPRSGATKSGSQTVLDGATGGPGDEASANSIIGSGRKTLRLKADGGVVIEDIQSDSSSKLINYIDDLLENFIGIRDFELAQTIMEISNGKTTVDDFAIELDSEFEEFQFPDEFIYDVWGVLHPESKSNLYVNKTVPKESDSANNITD